MKPTTLYLSALFLVFAAVGHVRASDSDSDMMFGESSLTDTEMANFNARLDKIADRTKRSYDKRIQALQKKGRVLTEEEKKKVFKECFQKKFDYAKSKTGGEDTIFGLGDRSIFQAEEI